MNKAVLEFSSRPENVAFARVAVSALASQLDYTISDLEEIKVAISEAVTNAIIHGYENNPDCMVRVEIKIVEEFMEVEIIDTGKGIEDINKALEPSYSTDPERMGLGFSFMQSFMEKFSVSSAPGKGTRVKMSRRAGTPGRQAVSEQ